jgi:hypothetical protein
MEHVIGMISTIGILFIPIILSITLLFIFWYSGVGFSWLFDNLLGLMDFLGEWILEICFSNNEYYGDFDFEFEDSNPTQENYETSPYEILGVSEDANPEEIHEAYRNLAKKYHPDLHPGNKEFEEKLKEINNAYEMVTKNKISIVTSGV